MTDMLKKIQRFGRSKARYSKAFLEVLLSARRGYYSCFLPIDFKNEELSMVKDAVITKQTKKVKPIITPQEMELAIYILTVFLSKTVKLNGTLVIDSSFKIASVYSKKVEVYEISELSEVLDEAVVSRTLVKLKRLGLIEYSNSRSNSHDKKVRITFQPIHSEGPLAHIIKFVGSKYI